MGCKARPHGAPGLAACLLFPPMKKTLARWFDSDVGYSFRTSPMAMLAAAIFLQLSPQDGRKPKANSEHELEH